MNIPVFDLHCDTAAELTAYGLAPYRKLASNEGHIDLKRGQRLSGYAQCFAFFTTDDMSSFCAWHPEVLFEKALSNFRAELEENRDYIAQVRTPEEAQKIIDEGKIAAILTLEGPAAIGFDPGRLDFLAEQGFVMTTLGWNERNPLAGSHKTGGGLTALGAEYVRKAQRYHMAIDVSHLSERAFWDIMNITQAPISASHSNSRAVCGVTRNLTDEQFKAICETGGVAGLNLCAYFLGDDPVTMDTVCDHVIHWLSLGGEKHIALGGDLDGCSDLPQGFTGVDCWYLLAEALLNRGISREMIEDIFWNNAMRMWSQCCM